MAITSNLRRLARNSLNGFVVRRFDRRVDMAARLARSGYCRYPPAPAHILASCGAWKPAESVFVTRELSEVLLFLVGLVRDDVTGFLGPRARIDNVYVVEVPSSEASFQSYSGSWHTDNVGNRLKLFLCLDGRGDVATAYVAGSNRGKFWPSLRDFARFDHRSDFSARPDETRLDHRTGDISMFDTNGLHRGVYDNQHSARTTLQIEFADRDKSDALAGRAAIGPGSAGIPSFFIARDIGDEFAERLLLDRSLFRVHDQNSYRYGR